MTRTGPRCLVRAVLAGVATAVLLASGAFATSAGAQAGDDDTPLTLRLVRQTAWVGPESVFEVAFTAEGVPAGARVRLELHNEVDTRAELDESARGEVDDTVIYRTPIIPVTEATGADGVVLLGLPVSAVDQNGPAFIRSGGVYPVAVVVYGADDERLGELVTTMLRLGPPPTTTSTPLAVGVVVPVRAAARPGPDGAPELGADAAERLRQIIGGVATRSDVPLTIAPSPESLELLERRDDTGAAAVQVLVGETERQVLTGPYAAIDTGVWTAGGLSGEMDGQYARGTATLQDLLGRRPTEGVAVLDRSVTPEALAHLQDLGVEAVVSPSGQLAPLVGAGSAVSTATLAEQFTIATGDDRSVLAVAADDAAGNRLRGGDDPILAAHQALAELAYLDQTSTAGGGRGVATVVPDDVDPVTLDTFLAGLADREGTASASIGEPMVLPVTLDRLFVATDPAPSGSGRTTPVERRYEADPPADLGAYPGRLRTARGSWAGLQSLVPSAFDLLASTDRTLLSSGARSLDADEQDRMLDSAEGSMQATTAEIVVTPEQIVTLTSSSGNVPLNLENRLQYPAEVLIRLTSDKLTFPQGPVMRQTLAPAQTTTINLPVETRASGAFPLTVAISSADGALPVATTRYTVRSTAISGIGLVLSIGAGLFLLVWWARHFRTSRRARQLVASNHPAVSGGEPDGYAPPDSDPLEGR